jgi:hypothetical protein
MPNVLKKSRLTLLFLLTLSVHLMAQETAIGQWRDHLAYTNGRIAVDAGDKVYCVASGNLFYYHKKNQEIVRQSKAEGFSDVDIAGMAYDPQTGILLLGYRNTNLDLLLPSGNILNMPDIYQKSILGNKTINGITAINGLFYVSCGFGIVVLDPVRKEIKDTYTLATAGTLASVQQVQQSGDTLYAATSLGLYKASANDAFLSDPSRWRRESYWAGKPLFRLAFFQGRLFTYTNTNAGVGQLFSRSLDSTAWRPFATDLTYRIFSIGSGAQELLVVYDGVTIGYNLNEQKLHILNGYFDGSDPREVVTDAQGLYWIADNNNALVMTDGVPANYFRFKPQGPANNNAVDIRYRNKTIWVAPGGAVGLRQGYVIGSISRFEGGEWNVLSGGSIYGKTGAFDLMAVCPDRNDARYAWVGAYSVGVLKVSTDSVEAFFRPRNSSLDSISGTNQVLVQGLDVDDNGTLWVANAGVEKPLSARSADGTWRSFAFPNQSLPNVQKLLASSQGYQWLLSEKTGAFVFYNGGTMDKPNDDQVRLVGFAFGKGGLPGSDIFSIAEDQIGSVWLGTDKGVAVVYSQFALFEPNPPDAVPIKIDQGGYIQYLLESETVTAIAVDDANRKWLGTQNSGVYLMNPDGTRQLEHFTVDNSPLISNSITSIAIQRETGEVFFGTSSGIMSYKAEATQGFEAECEDVLVYPNPVRESYQGPIAIRGMVKDADVKITDASGSLVYQTKALGGQAIWDGRNLKGQNLQSGVYFVFASNPDGSQGCSTKLVMFR